MMHNFPLVIFTVCQQLAIGSFILTGTVLLFNNFYREGVSVVSKRFFYVLCLAGVGLVASTFHLGMPWRGYNVFNRLGAAWLSNEVLCTTLFLAFGGIFWLLSVCKDEWVVIRKLFLMLAIFAGIGLSVAMICTYLIPTVPSWNNIYTIISFILTTLIGGAVISLLLISGTDFNSPGFVKTFHFIGLTALFCSALNLGLQVYHWSLTTSAVTGALAQFPDFFCYLKIRIAVMLIAFMLWLLLILKHHCPMALMGLLILIIAAEGCGRFLFYSAYMTVGL